MSWLSNIKKGFDEVASYFVGELTEIFHDSGVMVMFFLAMLAYPVIYALGYKNEVARNIPVAFVDLDHTSMSRQLGRMIDATEQVRITVRPQSLTEAKELFLQNRVSGVLLVDNSFEKNILRGNQSVVSVYSDAAHFLLYKQVYSAAVYASQTLGATIEVNNLLNGGMPLEMAMQQRSPLNLQIENLYNPAGGYATFIVPGILIVLIQQTLLIGIGLLYGKHNELRNYHYLQTGHRSLLQEVKIVFSQMLAFTLIYLLTTFMILGLFYRWLNLPDKSGLLKVYYVLIPYIVTVSFLGISIGLLFSKRVYSLFFLVFLSPLLFFMSGVSWPVQAMPKALHFAANFLPSTPMVNAFVRLRIMGANIQAVRAEYHLLMIQMVAYFLTAVFIYWMKLNRLRSKSQAEIK